MSTGKKGGKKIQSRINFIIENKRKKRITRAELANTIERI